MRGDAGAPAGRAWALDIAGSFAIVAGAAAAVVLGVPAWIRLVLGAPAFLFALGYLVLGALFPRRHRAEPPADGQASPPVTRGLDLPERIGLSFGVSIVLLPVVGLALAGTPGGWLAPAPTAMALLALTGGLALVAFWRRLQLPAVDRFQVALRLPFMRADQALTGLLAIAAVVAALAAGHALVTPPEPDPATDLYLLGFQGAADCYPARYAEGAYATEDTAPCPGDVGEVVLGIVNREGRQMSYRAMAVWVEEDRLPDGSTRMQGAQEWRSWDITLEDSRSPPEVGKAFVPQFEERLVLPPPPGNGTFRLSFLLFTEPPPTVAAADEFFAAAHREVRLWIEAGPLA